VKRGQGKKEKITKRAREFPGEGRLIRQSAKTVAEWWKKEREKKTPNGGGKERDLRTGSTMLQQTAPPARDESKNRPLEKKKPRGYQSGEDHPQHNC